MFSWLLFYVVGKLKGCLLFVGNLTDVVIVGNLTGCVLLVGTLTPSRSSCDTGKEGEKSVFNVRLQKPSSSSSSWQMSWEEKGGNMFGVLYLRRFLHSHTRGRNGFKRLFSSSLSLFFLHWSLAMLGRWMRLSVALPSTIIPAKKMLAIVYYGGMEKCVRAGNGKKYYLGDEGKGPLAEPEYSLITICFLEVRQKSRIFLGTGAIDNHSRLTWLIPRIARAQSRVYTFTTILFGKQWRANTTICGRVISLQSDIGVFKLRGFCERREMQVCPKGRK